MLEWKFSKPLVNGFSNQPQKGYLETSPDAGIPFRRLLFSDIFDLVTCSFSFTREEYANFISWYRFDLKQGALPFLFFDCRYKKNRVARIIGDVPQYQTESNRFKLNLQIGFEPDIIYSEKLLTVADNKYLIVNGNDRLVVNYGLRI